jgi:hypothetical protein
MKKNLSGKRKRWFWVAGALVSASVLLFTPPGEVLWVGLYPVLVWFNVDHWFRWTEDVALSDLSGSGVAEAGSVARAKEIAKLSVAMYRGLNTVDWGWKLLDPGTGTVVRVRVWTWHPLKSVSVARGIRNLYETHATDPEARIAADFATWWGPYGIDDEYTLPPPVDFPPAASGVPWEPVFDENAQLVLRAGTNAVPHLLEIATCPNSGWDNPLEAHVLLCKILGVHSRGADDEWCGIRANDWFENRRDTPDVRAIWTLFRDTGALPADADGFFSLREDPQP